MFCQQCVLIPISTAGVRGSPLSGSEPRAPVTPRAYQRSDSETRRLGDRPTPGIQSGTSTVTTHTHTHTHKHTHTYSHTHTQTECLGHYHRGHVVEVFLWPEEYIRAEHTQHRH